MNRLEENYDKIRFTLIGLFILTILIVFLLLGNEYNVFTSENMSAIFIPIVFSISFPILLVISFRKALHSIDMFILSIPYSKINNQTFICQVCKEIVESEDDFCSNCGMML